MPVPQQHPNIRLLKGHAPGTDSGGRKVQPPPPFVRAAPEPPTWLPKEAKAEWRRVVPELERLRILKKASRGALTSYAMSWLAVTIAAKRVDELTDDHSTLEHSRRLGTLATATKAYRDWCNEFGLTPSAENRLTVPEADDDEADFD